MKRRVVAAITAASDDPAAEEKRRRDDRFGHLRAVAGEFSEFRQARDALPRVRAVPTIFPQLDCATRVGGLPIERITLIHGESAGGKTYLTLAMILSFLMKDHFAYLIDAERTTPITWVENVYAEHADHPFFMADRPDTYEEVKKNVRRFCKRVADARAAKKIPANTTALIVVDSIRKLVPKDQFAEIMKAIATATAKGATDADIDKARSRIHQLKAQMNAVWMDELVPLLEKTGCAMIVIAREIVDPDNGDDRARKAKTNVRTTGGSSLFFDASLDLRTVKAGAYGKETGGGDEKKFVAHGLRYRVDIKKTKVAGEEWRASFLFHISNGSVRPAGFDRPKDLLELAKQFKVIETKGSWFKFKKKRWQGEERALAALAADAALLADLEATTRARFKLEKTR